MVKFAKTGVLIILISVVFSLLLGLLTPVFGLFTGSINYISTGSVGLVLTTILSFLTWFLDLIFLDINSAYYTLKLAPSVTVGSINWAVSVFRIIAGCSIFVIILSLIFGNRG